MTAIRLPCPTPGCTATILPETAARTGGFCMPCVKRVADQQRQAMIAANRRDVNFYAGVADSIEILRLMHTPRKHDPLIREVPYPLSAEEVCAAITAHDLKRLVTMLQSWAGTDQQEIACDIAVSLRRSTDHALDPFLESLLDAGECYPDFIFLGASSHVRDRIIEKLISPHKVPVLAVNHALSALAWIGDEGVVRQFSHWRDHPPPWAKKANDPPHCNAHHAGWELRADGSRRELTYGTCYSLEARPEGKVNDVFGAILGAGQPCPWCDRELVYLVRVEWPLKPSLTVLTCETCTAFCDHLHASGGFSSNPTWSASNKRPNYLPTDSAQWPGLPRNALSLSPESRRSVLTCHLGWGEGSSQLGGHPAWVQDSAYPVCWECQATMKFLAQIAVEDVLLVRAEGMYYAFVCETCGTTATSYQQT